MPHLYDDLCLQAKAGDNDAMERMLKIMFKIVGKYLSGLPMRFRIGYEIKDLAQTSMIGILEGIKKFDPSIGVPAESWLLKVAQRKINTELKNQNREKRKGDFTALSLSLMMERNSSEPRTLEEMIVDKADIEAEVVDELTASEIYSALSACLTPMELRVLQLQYAGYSGPAIAEKMGIRYKAFDNAQQRTRKKARKLLGGTL